MRKFGRTRFENIDKRAELGGYWHDGVHYLAKCEAEACATTYMHGLPPAPDPPFQESKSALRYNYTCFWLVSISRAELRLALTAALHCE